MSEHEAKAAEIGAEHGHNAATWVFDGNTTRETYAAVLKGIEEGDPLILDAYEHLKPTLAFSPHAEDYTATDLALDLDLEWETLSEKEASDIEEAYIFAAGGAFWHEVERAARYQLS